MTAAIHPQQALYHNEQALPSIPVCEHIAGNEKFIKKALELQAQIGPVFDITVDFEDGAPAGDELAHLHSIVSMLAREVTPTHRVGIRIHDIQSRFWQEELQSVLKYLGNKIRYISIPKVTSVMDVDLVDNLIRSEQERLALGNDIPLQVMIETPEAVDGVWEIAAHESVQSLNFGIMDYISALHGAVSADCMKSPGQFSHHLIVRAKAEIVAAALHNAKIPCHNVCVDFNNETQTRADADEAFNTYGFLRMWSIHPSQITPIVEAFSPQQQVISEAENILFLAQDACWGPIKHNNRLHDRASFRYYWDVLQRAHSCGLPLSKEALVRFF